MKHGDLHLLITHFWELIPRGGSLPDEVWRQRHQIILRIQHVQGLSLFCLALFTGHGLVASVLGGMLVSGLALLAASDRLPRHPRAALASMSAFASSALLVHYSGGYIEMHFHFFVMVALIALYQDWIPFLVNLGLVVVHHGTIGVLAPSSVYNHAAALAHPWTWVLIHGAFVLAETAAILTYWRLNELANQELMATEQRFRLVIESAPNGILISDGNGGITLVNAQVERCFGYRREELLGQPVECLIAERHRGWYQTLRTAFCQAPTVRDMNSLPDLFGRRKDGTAFPVEFSLTPIETSTGRQVLASIVDITERKQAKSEQTRLLTVLNASLNEIYMFRTDTLRFTYVNLGALDNLGYTLEAMQALTPIDIKPEVTEASFRELVNPLLTGEQALLIFQTVHQRKNGSTYSVEVHLQIVGQGEERTFLAFIYDVTARKKQEHCQATEHTITQLLLESNTLEEAVPGILERICRTLDWNVGVLWRVDEEMQVLRCAEVWGEQHADCAQFIERTRQSNFAMGIGLPGRVWKSRRVEWITDVTRDDNFPRAPYAVDAGLHAAFAFPIGSGDRLHGVIEFFAPALREPDQKLLDMVDGLAGQISQFLDRKQAKQRLQ